MPIIAFIGKGASQAYALLSYIYVLRFLLKFGQNMPMEGNMQAHTLSFRAGDAFVAETRTLAEQAGLKRSDYIREAGREKNERMMAERIAALSRKLSAKHLAENQAIEGTIADGLA